MKNKIRVLTLVFNALFPAVKQKYERALVARKLNKPTKVSEYFGFEKKIGEESSTHSLMDDIIEAGDNFALREYVEQNDISGISKKHLYNLTREFVGLAPYDSVWVEKRVMDTLAMYAGYASFEKYANEGPGIVDGDRKIQQQVLTLREDELAPTELADHFIGFYYSYRSRCRKMVRFIVNFYNKSANGYVCELHGIHDEEHDYSGVKYLGYLEDRPKCSYVQMEEKQNGRPFVMIGFKEHTPSRELQYIRCAVTGVSQFGNPFSAEILFVRVQPDQRNLSREDILPSIEQIAFIDFYLQAQRRNFRIPARLIRGIGEIRARKHKASTVQGIVGTYRVLTLGENQGLVQSRYIINEKFVSELYTDSKEENHRRQPCMFSISERSGKLCVAAHVDQGISVVNYAIFDIDPTGNREVLPGVYCGMGSSEDKYYSGNILLIKEREEFEVGPMQEKELLRVVRQRPKIIRTLLDDFLDSAGLTNRLSKVQGLESLLETELRNHYPP